MKQNQNVVLLDDGMREVIPDFSDYFPYVGTYTEFDHSMGDSNPWHWHNAIELLYVEQGQMEYTTPKGSILLSEHSAVLVNTGVLHCTKWITTETKNIQKIHLFDPEFLSGGTNNRIYDLLVAPLAWRKDIDLIPIYAEEERNMEILKMIHGSFELNEEERGFEFRIRYQLSEIWLRLLDRIDEIPVASEDWLEGEIKTLLGFIYAHYADTITIDDLAGVGLTSRRQVFRIFQNTLHTTPMEYIEKYRIQIACKLLAETNLSITEIAMQCGMNSISYFGKRFRHLVGQTPSEYRRRWHETANDGRSTDS